jgi:hypothetical protein
MPRSFFPLLFLVLPLAACGDRAVPALPAAVVPAPAFALGQRLALTPPASTKAAVAASFRQTSWEELMPADWDPGAPFRNLDLASLKDSDPRAQEALATLHATWDNAPTAPQMNGAAIRIAGFIVPLERDGDAVSELLLVPYFGACVHVPPPPANQIIHVLVDPPLTGARTMDTMWISGTLEIVRSPTSLGTSAYRLKATTTAPYVAAPRPMARGAGVESGVVAR